jgi:hypothetical protein
MAYKNGLAMSAGITGWIAERLPTEGHAEAWTIEAS